MKALQFSRKEVRYAAAAVSSRLRRGSGATTGPLNLVEASPFELPGPGWHRVNTRLAGICGSDLATVDGKSSRYFEPWVSFPFVPGHEVVGSLEDGQRVVLEPVLGHQARGLDAPFEGAAPGDGDDYQHLVSGNLEPGIQTGYCASTGGGWSSEFVAHESQLHIIPDALSDEAAVMVEPAAVGIHAALKAGLERDTNQVIAILGAGTMGLVAVAAARNFYPESTIITAAKYPEQRRFASDLGADTVVAPDEFQRAVRRVCGGFVIGNDLSGGADVVIDAVGNASSVQLSISTARPRGRVVLVGMPGKTTLDLTSLWHRETELVGAYTYGTEHMADGSKVKTFDLALELAATAKLDRLVTASYSLEDYEEALLHAASAGERGAIKICFDLR